MKRAIAIILVVLTGLAAFYAFRRVSAGATPQGGLVTASGRVDGEHIVIAARSAGRVAEFLVNEGESVARGQSLARLEDAAAAARAVGMSETVEVLESKLHDEQAGLLIMQAAVPVAIKAAEARAELAKAARLHYENEEIERRREVERLRLIEDPDDEARRRLADAVDSHEESQRALATAQDAAEQMESEVDEARAGEEDIAARIHEMETLRAERDNARLVLRGVQNAVISTTVVAPSEGIVSRRRVVVGSEATPGAAILEMVDVRTLGVMVDVSENERSLIAVGQEARIYVEGRPDEPVDAEVAAVAPHLDSTLGGATWSVRVVPAKSRAATGGGRLPLGMKADVVIRVRDGAPWAAPSK